MNEAKNKLVDDILAGKSDKQKAGDFARWLATSEGQAYLASHMDAEFNSVGEEIEEDRGCAEEKLRILDCLQQKIHRRTMLRRLKKATVGVASLAAIIILLISLHTQVSIFNAPLYRDIYVSKGERMQMAFQDGTQVYLYPGSHLRYPDRFALNERKVYLDGEAYFEVSKNARRPFLVELDKATVRVTGTSFHVKAYACKTDIILCLDKGKVQLMYGDQLEFPLNPGQTLLYNKEDNQCTLGNHPQGDFSALTHWKEQIIAFNETPLKAVLEELNLYYDRSFVVEDTLVNHFSYTLSMRKPSLQEVLNTLEIISPVHFEQGDTIKVRMKQN